VKEITDLHQTEFKIQTSELPSGVYFYTVSNLIAIGSAGGKTSGKLIVQ
jgi:hypothetical protein